MHIYIINKMLFSIHLVNVKKWNIILTMNSMQICNSVMFYFIKKLIFWYWQEVYFANKKMIRVNNLSISENEFFHEIKRNGITSLHGIHVWHVVSYSTICLADAVHAVVLMRG